MIRAFDVRQVLAQRAELLADEQPALEARRPTSRTWPFAKSSTCSAPG
jgi:hypothetical protein